MDGGTGKVLKDELEWLQVLERHPNLVLCTEPYDAALRALCQSDYAALEDDVEALSPKYLLSPTDEPSSYDNWYDSFTAYCGSEGLTGYDTNKDTFYDHLHTFLQVGAGVQL